MPKKAKRAPKAKSARRAKPARKAKPAPSARRAKPAAKKAKPSGLPEGSRTVTPHLVCAGASEAIEFYRRAFGAEEVRRMPGPDGKIMHAAIRIGDSLVMLVDEFPEWDVRGPRTLQGTPVTIHLYVPDVDAFVERAVAAGAKITMPIDDMFWGDRYGKIEDPFGHAWSVATHLRDPSLEEMREAMRQMANEAPATDAGSASN